MRGLRTWLIQHHTDSQGREREIVLKDLKDAVKPLAQKAGKEAIQTRTTFGTLLREAIAQGADFSVQPASAATHKQRRLAYEIAWGVHAHRLKRLVPQHQHAHCRRCGRILTNSHMVAGCETHTRLRTAHRSLKCHIAICPVCTIVFKYCLHLSIKRVSSKDYRQDR